MTIKEKLQALGKELLTLAGLQADIEGRVAASKEKLERLIAQNDEALDEMENEHY